MRSRFGFLLAGALLLASSSASATYGPPPPKPAGPLAVATPAAPTFLQAVTLMVYLTPSMNGASVTLMDGATSVGTAVGTGNTATFTLPKLSAGAHTFTWNDSGFGGSTFSLSVAEASTHLTLTQSGDTTNAGDGVTFTATITSDAGPFADDGEVQFMDGEAPIGAAIAVHDGAATFASSALLAGTHDVSAVFNGSTNYTTSTAAGVVHIVNVASASATTPGGGGAATTTPTTPAGGAPGTKKDEHDADASCSSSGRSGAGNAWLIGLAVAFVTAARGRRRSRS